jgi:hypothetical protein
MKKIIIFIVSLFFSFTLFSQNKKHTYVQFEASVSLKGNANRSETDRNENTNNSWFLPDGLSSKMGYGLHYNKWIALGIHSGIDWKWTDKLVVVPVFANLKLSPKISEDTRVTLQLGLGKTIALGRGDLMGNYKKISLGIQNLENIILFIELSHYQIPINNQKDTGSISLGIALISF